MKNSTGILQLIHDTMTIPTNGRIVSQIHIYPSEESIGIKYDDKRHINFSLRRLAMTPNIGWLSMIYALLTDHLLDLPVIAQNVININDIRIVIYAVENALQVVYSDAIHQPLVFRFNMRIIYNNDLSFLKQTILSGFTRRYPVKTAEQPHSYSQSDTRDSSS